MTIRICRQNFNDAGVKVDIDRGIVDGPITLTKAVGKGTGSRFYSMFAKIEWGGGWFLLFKEPEIRGDYRIREFRDVEVRVWASKLWGEKFGLDCFYWHKKELGGKELSFYQKIEEAIRREGPFNISVESLVKNLEVENKLKEIVFPRVEIIDFDFLYMTKSRFTPKSKWVGIEYVGIAKSVLTSEYIGDGN